MSTLTHFDRRGRARMVHVGAKPATHRQAEVACRLHLSAEAFEAIGHERLAKGDAFTVAKVAGIQAAKRTSEWIPLCHPVPIEHLDVVFALEAGTRSIRVVARAATTAKTGIEMEAFVAAAAAALTLYDMVKAVDPSATITELQLIQKVGGTRAFVRQPA